MQDIQSGAYVSPNLWEMLNLISELDTMTRRQISHSMALGKLVTVIRPVREDLGRVVAVVSMVAMSVEHSHPEYARSLRNAVQIIEEQQEVLADIENVLAFIMRPGEPRGRENLHDQEPS